MLNISIYHWLPIADNMMPEILDALKALSGRSIYEVSREGDFVAYGATFSVYANDREVTTLSVRGKIDSRGFSRHSIEVSSIEGFGVDGTINLVVPSATTWLRDTLFLIIPVAVRNKLAVLQEGIVSFTRFPSTVFHPSIDGSAKTFLDASHVAVVLLEGQYWEEVKRGFVISRFGLRVPAQVEKPRGALVFPDNQASFLLFYSEAFTKDELDQMAGVIFKFCALRSLLDFSRRVIQILKETRDHVMPLRRQLAIALQRNTEEHFMLLERMKKYLTYVNIKLPVVYKVVVHLESALTGDSFVTLVDPFGRGKLASLTPAINALSATNLGVASTIEQLEENTKRVGSLYREDERELEVLSRELSRVMEGSLLAENIKLSARGIDISEAILELDRGAKHRANALKVLSVIVSVNAGVVVADLVNMDGPLKGVVAVLLTAAIWISLELFIKARSAYFRLVIPVHSSVPGKSLDRLTDKNLITEDANGSRRTRTWRERLFLHLALGIEAHGLTDEEKASAKFDLARNGPLRTFDFTVDYEKRGFIHSIALETEHYKSSFSTRDLVLQVFGLLKRAGCLGDYSDVPRSLFTETLSRLGVQLNPRLLGLNRLLSSPTEELEQILLAPRVAETVSALSPEDWEFVIEVQDNKAHYLTWLGETLEEKSSELLRDLIGAYNLREKLYLVGRIGNDT